MQNYNNNLRKPSQPPAQRSSGPDPVLPEVLPQTDDDLGIGVEHDPLAALMASSQFSELLDRAVTTRIAQMQAAVPAVGGEGAAMAAIVASLDKLLNVHASQQPGYQKPLPADVVEKRAAGFVEMNALIDKFKASGKRPVYRLVGEPLFAGEILYPENAEVATFIYPNEYMAPLNDPARQVHKAMMQWIGGEQMSIGERVAQAEAEKAGRLAPDHSPFAAAGLPEASPVQIVTPPPEVRGFDPRRPPQAAHQVSQGPYTV